MPALQKITTEYIETEDRFRLSGESSTGELHSFWLTQRLLSKLIRVLISTFEDTPNKPSAKHISDDRTNALFNEMAQQAAQQQIADQPPVIDPELDKSWLVFEVDINKLEQHIKLTFKNSANEPLELLLDQNQLRQWLSIVHKIWQQAEWPLAVWPEWILNTVKPAMKSKSAMH